MAFCFQIHGWPEMSPHSIPTRSAAPRQLLIGFGLLAAAWLAVIGVDMLNLFGAGDSLYDRMIDRNTTRSWVWVMLFSEGAPIEILQWLTLTLGARRPAKSPPAGRLQATGTESWHRPP